MGYLNDDVVIRLQHAREAAAEPFDFAADAEGWSGWLCLRGGDWEDHDDAEDVNRNAIAYARDRALECVDIDDPAYERTIEILTWNTEPIPASRLGPERASTDDGFVLHISPEDALEQARRDVRSSRSDMLADLVATVRYSTRPKAARRTGRGTSRERRHVRRGGRTSSGTSDGARDSDDDPADLASSPGEVAA